MSQINDYNMWMHSVGKGSRYHWGICTYVHF